MFVKRLACILLLMTSLCLVRAQEFKCTVQVNSEKLMASNQKYETTDKKVFETMKQSLEDFVNGRKWTNVALENHEKLECSIGLVLSQRNSATDYVGQMTVQLRRPVFSSNYTTGLFNYIENNFSFQFNESQSLEFDPSTFYSTLTSTVAYYLYIMLGEYFDSFSLNGGEAFYAMASMIAQTAASSQYHQGWKSSEGQKARFWFQENHTNSAYSQLHKAYYDYHRLGLDMMTKDQTQARANILMALQDLQEVTKVKANLLSVQQFVDVKISEIVSIFTPAPQEEQQQVYMAIRALSPINVSKLKDWNLK